MANSTIIQRTQHDLFHLLNTVPVANSPPMVSVCVVELQPIPYCSKYECCFLVVTISRSTLAHNFPLPGQFSHPLQLVRSTIVQFFYYARRASQPEVWKVQPKKVQVYSELFFRVMAYRSIKRRGAFLSVPLYLQHGIKILYRVACLVWKAKRGLEEHTHTVRYSSSV